MASQLPVTAIFDIGKTNKKFLLFDQRQSVVHQAEVTFDEIEDDDGDPCEDLGRLVAWVKQEFQKAAQNRSFRITGLNFATYGATLVHIDGDGRAAAPLYNYLKPYPENLIRQFYDAFGGRERVCVETASGPLGMLNSGLQLYWLKHRKPEVFSKITCSLHFPQYLSYLFTGRRFSEMTSIGCHTAMWNYQTNEYHRWVGLEGMVELLAEIAPVFTTHRIDFNGLPVDAGIGIHDSSASLAPYLLAAQEPFIQLSTGTWSIALNPFAERVLTYAELKQDCLLYMNIFGKPVRASRLFLGREFAHQVRRLGKHFGRNPERIDCRPDAGLFRRLAAQGDPAKRLKPEESGSLSPGSDRDEESWDVSAFGSYEEACHQLMLDLVALQVQTLRLAVEGDGTNRNRSDVSKSGQHAVSAGIDRIIVTGGFSNNVFFTRLLATFLAPAKIYTATASNATALGASLVISKPPPERSYVQSLLGLQRQGPFDDLDLRGYSRVHE